MDRWYDDIDDIRVPKNFTDQAELYTTLLLSYAKIHNITALKTRYQVLESVADSVYPIRYIEPLPKTIADIGSGAGFPGIPLALALPQCEITLYEPLTKKSAFLHWIKAELKLSNVQIRLERIENETKKFEFIVSRAVSNISTLLKLTRNCSSAHTRYLLYKGTSVADELKGNFTYEVYSRKNRNYVLLKDVVWL